MPRRARRAPRRARRKSVDGAWTPRRRLGDALRTELSGHKSSNFYLARVWLEESEALEFTKWLSSMDIYKLPGSHTHITQNIF